MALLNRVRDILGLSPAASRVGSWTCGAIALLAAGGVCWIAWGGSPPAALAADGDGATLFAFAVGEEGEREERRDGDREGGEGEERRDGHRPRGERDGDRPRGERDGDRPREEGERDRPRGERDGDRPRGEGEARPDRPSPQQFRRHIEEMKVKVRALAEQGRRDEAEALENEIHQRLRARHEGEGERDRPRGDGPPRDFAGSVNPELLQMIRELREEVGRLRREVNELKGGPGPRDGDRPRLDRDEDPRPKDVFRPDRPRREGEGDCPQFDRPRDGERGDGDRPGERDRDPPPRGEDG